MKPTALSFSLAGIPYLGTAYVTMDCQDFVEKTLRKIGIDKNLPGSNAWYREMTWVGSPEECKQRFGCIPKGAFLFILEQDGKEPAKYRGDGIGNASHIGIYTGLTGQRMVSMATATGNNSAASCDFGDGAIHSSMSRGCVATSKFAGKSISGGWNRIGLWDALDWGEEINQLLTGKGEGNSSPAIPETITEYDSPSDSGVPVDVDTVTSATVWAENGLPVKMRQSRDRKNRNFGLYDEYPVGTPAEILISGTEWSKVRIAGRTGWMMSRFLNPEGNEEMVSDVPGTGTEEPAQTFPAGESAAPTIASLRSKMQELMEAIDQWMKEDDHR